MSLYLLLAATLIVNGGMGVAAELITQQLTPQKPWLTPCQSLIQILPGHVKISQYIVT